MKILAGERYLTKVESLTNRTDRHPTSEKFAATLLAKLDLVNIKKKGTN